jgi:hypothetical protein
VRNPDDDGDRSFLNFPQALEHLDRRRLGIEGFRPFRQSRNLLGHDARTGGDHEDVVLMHLAAFRDHLVLVELKLFDRVDVEIDALFEQARLVTIKLIRGHLSECDIQQTGLIHVLVRCREQRQPDLAGANLGRQPPRKIVGHNGSACATTDD